MMCAVLAVAWFASAVQSAWRSVRHRLLVARLNGAVDRGESGKVHRLTVLLSDDLR